MSRSTNKSLVIIDEFGISTRETDGVALLASSLNFWTNQKSPDSEDNREKRGCPMIFLSTHYFNLFNQLRNPDLIKRLVRYN